MLYRRTREHGQDRMLLHCVQREHHTLVAPSVPLMGRSRSVAFQSNPPPPLGCAGVCLFHFGTLTTLFELRFCPCSFACRVPFTKGFSVPFRQSTAAARGFRLCADVMARTNTPPLVTSRVAAVQIERPGSVSFIEAGTRVRRLHGVAVKRTDTECLRCIRRGRIGL